MKKIKFLYAAIIMVFLLAQAGAEEKIPTFQLKDVLVPGGLEMELMVIGGSPRAAELTEKLNAALATNKDWLQTYIKEKSKPGQPLPYHQNLGLSREEYTEYLKEIDHQTLQPTGKKIPVEFVVENQVLRLKIEGDTSPMSDIKIHLDTNELSASVGKIGKAKWGGSDRKDIPIGPWEGYSWKYEKANKELTDIRIVSVKVYRLKNTGQIVWMVEDSEIVNKEAKKRFDIILGHSVPKKSE